MEEDILKFCYNLSLLSPQQKSAYANALLNDNPKMETFVDKLFHYENNLLSDNFFLSALNFAVDHMRIPFILYLNCSEFCILIETRFKRLKKEEKVFLKEIFEKMFEKFLDYENLESNLDNLEILVKLYLETFQSDLSTFYNERKGVNSKSPQNDFERLYNSAKTKIKAANQEIQSDLTVEQIDKLIKFLESVEISLKFGQNPSEKTLLKELMEEKETLVYVLNSFYPDNHPDNPQPKKPLPDKIEEEVKINHNPGYIIIEDEDDSKIPKKLKTQEIKKPEEKKLEEYTSLPFHSNVLFPEDIETEYKNYFFPLDEHHRKILRRTICAFLNTYGGRIYIGIRDEDQCVLGLELTTKDQDNVRLVIDDLLKEITPKVDPDECVTKFIPLKSYPENQFIPGCYVIKIIIKRGKLNDLYFTTNGLT